jgi:hypothetical protein
MQGWGSNEACTDMVNSDLNEVAVILHYVPDLIFVVSPAHEGTPVGTTVRSGSDGDISYTIRDQDHPPFHPSDCAYR